MTTTSVLRDDPVILLGMHHSGTSIFAEVLDRGGVFMHANMHHHESKFFTRDINGTLIMGGSANWSSDPIMPVADVMAKLDLARAAMERKALKKFIRDGYDGVSPWGWKDPRTCVTIPLFLQLYPKARLLHIVREEADVAESLASRRKKDVGLLADRDRWRSLHRQHVQRAREYGSRHKDYHEFRYEDFARQPVEVTKPIFERLGLEFTESVRGFLEERIYSHRVGIANGGND